MKKSTDLFVCLGLSGGGFPLLLTLAAFANGVEINLRHVVGWSAAGVLTGSMIHLVRYQVAGSTNSESFNPTPNAAPRNVELPEESDFYSDSELAAGLRATSALYNPLTGATIAAHAEPSDPQPVRETPTPKEAGNFANNPYARDFLS